MNGFKIIFKTIIVCLIAAVVLVPTFGIGYCAFEVSTIAKGSEEENRELMCEQCWDSAPLAVEILGCNEDILREKGFYNEYR